MAAADNVSVAGKWHVHDSIAGNDSDSDCTFVQKTSTCTGHGTRQNEKGSMTITGKFEGKKVTWSYKSEYNGSPLTVNHEGTLNDDKIVGTAHVPEYSVDGDFTATSSEVIIARLSGGFRNESE